MRKGLLLQDAEVEVSVSGSRGRDEDDSEGDEMQRHVEFKITEDGGVIEEGGCESDKPNRLHRRDTPHHLKNKRIHAAIDPDKVASIIKQVSIS